ncbi:hypothetical protein ACROYT_G020050 [Oculina patagonica]
MMKGCLNLLCLVLLPLLVDEVEASNLTASVGTIALAICYFLILVAGIILLIKYRKECKCKRQNEEPTTTSIRNVQRHSPVALQRPEFNQATYPQRSAPLHVQPPPPGTALLLEVHVGEPPPPYPGM